MILERIEERLRNRKMHRDLERTDRSRQTKVWDRKRPKMKREDR
jgi:hypothetical protein